MSDMANSVNYYLRNLTQTRKFYNLEIVCNFYTFYIFLLQYLEIAKFPYLVEIEEIAIDGIRHIGHGFRVFSGQAPGLRKNPENISHVTENLLKKLLSFGQHTNDLFKYSFNKNQQFLRQIFCYITYIFPGFFRVSGPARKNPEAMSDMANSVNCDLRDLAQTRKFYNLEIVCNSYTFYIFLLQYLEIVKFPYLVEIKEIAIDGIRHIGHGFRVFFRQAPGPRKIRKKYKYCNGNLLKKLLIFRQHTNDFFKYSFNKSTISSTNFRLRNLYFSGYPEENDTCPEIIRNPEGIMYRPPILYISKIGKFPRLFRVPERSRKSGFVPDSRLSRACRAPGLANLQVSSLAKSGRATGARPGQARRQAARDRAGGDKARAAVFF